MFPLSFPSGSSSPFREVTVTLPPSLWRGTQLLTLVPLALLPVWAGLELWGYGEQIKGYPLPLPGTPPQLSSASSLHSLGYGHLSPHRLQSSVVRCMWRQRRKPVCRMYMCSGGVCVGVCGGRGQEESKQHGQMSHDLQDGTVGVEVKTKRQGLRPWRRFTS